MAARPSMAALISRMRLLVNDPSGSGQIWTDDQIQGVMDESRIDARNQVLKPIPTFSGSTIQYLDYFSLLGSWEDDYVLKQYLTVPVTPSAVEPIVGHFVFAATTLPPVYITGKLYDIYRAAADLLERQAAQWVLRYNMTVDGQSLQRGNVTKALQDLAHTFRLRQRTSTINVARTDIRDRGMSGGLSLDPTAIDYMAGGNGR